MQAHKHWSLGDWLAQLTLGLIVVGFALALGGYPQVGLALAAGGLLLVVGGLFVAFVLVIGCGPVDSDEPGLSINEIMSAFDDGRSAFERGAMLGDNPMSGSAYLAWRDGWLASDLASREIPPGPFLKPGAIIAAILLPVVVLVILCEL